MIPQVFLEQLPAGILRPGHPWIYKRQLKLQGVQMAAGTLVDVFTDRGRPVGRGYCNLNSTITVRLLSSQEEEIGPDFFRRKIEKARAYRQRFIRDTDAFRLISSEADGLPGLVVDLYRDVMVVQFLTAGMENLKGEILAELSELVPSRGIYERSDSSSRALEGLEEVSGWIEKNCDDEMMVQENDIQYSVNFRQGHKTGLYLDQRDNRRILRQLGIKGRVLDVFCYEGGFGLHLARGGATVIGIDIQAKNIARAELHRRENGIPEENLEFRTADAFEELRRLEAAREKFDLVILDPPSFVKKKESIQGALAGFKEISLRGMKILNEGGLLAIFSCSYHVDESHLLSVAASAALDARKHLKILRRLDQSADHPVDPLIPETHYLKGFLFHVTSV